MGVKETPEEAKLPLKNIVPIQAPVNFSSAETWPNCESIKEVRDQSNCGSCWAFGAVEAISDRICIASGQTLQTRISAQDLLTCCGFSCGSGCNGGYPASAWSYWKNTGLVTGWLYNTSNWCKPYSLAPCDHHTTGKYTPCSGSSATPSCSKSCVSGYPTPYASDINKGSSVYSVPSNVAQIQTELMTHGPIEASFTVYEDFLSYKTGVYQNKAGIAFGGHAVKIVGWGVDNGTPYWLVANSWNTDWAENGFFRILRGKNECGIEDGVVAGLPK